MKIFASVAIMLFSLTLFAQQPQDEETAKKQYEESINKEIDRMTDLLNLEDWQTFYLDSIFHHDYLELRTELMQLSKAKVSNADIYTQIQDKWMEKIYNSVQRILDETQWQKYLKSGAAKSKKDRDKREAKRKG